MIDFTQMPCVYWPDRVKVNYLQRRVIIHSIIYYNYNQSVVSDYFFDSISMQLVRMQEYLSKEDLEQTTYFYCMKDFDGSTGFDIPDKLNQKDKVYLNMLADMILIEYNKDKGENKC